MTARERFEKRWGNEQETNPQPPENKEREYMVYLCGWEDGIRKHIEENAVLSAPSEGVSCYDCGTPRRRRK